MYCLARPAIIIGILLLVGVVILPAEASHLELLDAPDSTMVRQVKSLKVDQRLYRVKDLLRATALSTEDAWQQHRVRIFGDSIQVRVLLKHDATSNDLDFLRESGGRVERHHSRSVQMVVPFESLSWFEQQEVVAAVYVPNYAIPTEVITEGIDTIGVPPYHDLGYKGQGVKIAVIDGGFEDYYGYLGSELPFYVGTKSFAGSISSGGTHGTMCAQIVYDIAPEAELWLVKVSTSLDFSDACDWIKDNDFDVVSISIGYFNHGWLDGSSNLSQKIDELRNHGILCVKSAGNYAQYHYWGYFDDSDGDSYHEFSGYDECNKIFLVAGQKLNVFLMWNDWPYSDNDYDLRLYDSDCSIIIDLSYNLQNGTQHPTEWIYTIAPYTGYYNLLIRNYDATGIHKFNMFILRSESIEHSDSYQSMSVPGDAEGALTVGAVPWYAPHTIESYSSRGPTDDGRTKPDLVAPDDVSVRDGYLTVDFPGTSAACPHVAGAAAVYLSYNPSVVPAAVTDTFKTMCIDLGAYGPDNTYGWGLLHLRGPYTNSPPVLADPGDKEVSEGQTLSFYLIATDADGDDLTFSASNLPTGATFDGATGYFNWQPSYTQAGSYYVTFSVTDGKATDEVTVKITVNNVNRPPEIQDIADMEVNENELVAFVVIVSDPDEDDQIDLSATSLPSGSIFTPSSGSFLWVPSYDQAGVYEITFVATDGEAQDEETVTITVANVNRAPAIDEIPNVEVNENEPVTFSVVAHDPDAEDTVTLEAVALPLGAVFDANTGSFYWTPSFEQAGTHTASFSASDGELVANEVVNITVINVNRAPSVFSLISPADGDSIGTTNPTLLWQTVSDPDSGDIVTYTLYLSSGDTAAWNVIDDEIPDTFRVTSDLEEAQWYCWKVKAEDNGGKSVFCDATYEFFVRDITPPSFEITVLPNSILQHELDVYVIPSEPIIESPSLMVHGTSHSDTLSCAASYVHYSELYLADISLADDGSYTIEVCGIDSAFNMGCSDLHLTISTISPEQGGKICHQRGQVTLSMEQQSLAKERRVLIISAASGGAPVNGGLPIFSVTIQPEHLELLKPALLRIEVPGEHAGNLTVCRRDNGRAIPVVVIDDGRTLECTIRKLGTFLVTASEPGNICQENSAPEARSDLSLQNHPNPFNEGTTISFNLPQVCHAELTIYNLMGQRVKVLLNSVLPAGEQAIAWDGRDESGHTLATGVYIAHLRAGQQVQTEKMLILK